jgi:cytochrome c-type biogenesis protein
MSDPAAGIGLIGAVFAGAVSFLSPCVLPLVPGYLSTVGGPAATAGRPGARTVLVRRALVFCLTFTLIFMALGLTATQLGSVLQAHRTALKRGAAVVIVAMGLVYLTAGRIPVLSRELRSRRLTERVTRGTPVLAGASFAIAWTPCIGPTLGAILAAASVSGSAGHGALLLAFYSAGLAVPFLATALTADRALRALRFVRRHQGAVVAVGGMALIATGVLMWTGELFRLNVEAERLMAHLGIDFYSSV